MFIEKEASSGPLSYNGHAVTGAGQRCVTVWTSVITTPAIFEDEGCEDVVQNTRVLIRPHIRRNSDGKQTRKTKQ